MISRNTNTFKLKTKNDSANSKINLMSNLQRSSFHQMFSPRVTGSSFARKGSLISGATTINPSVEGSRERLSPVPRQSP